MFGDDGLEEAGSALETFYRFFERFERVTGESFYDISPPTKRHSQRPAPGDNPLLVEASKRHAAFVSKMDDDFNTGAATGDLFDLVRALNKFVDQHQLEENKDSAAVDTLKAGATTLKELSNVLGIFRSPPPRDTGGSAGLVDQIVPLLVEIRADARANKDFATSDQVRDQLSALGITLEDRQGETSFRVDASAEMETVLDKLVHLLIEIRANARAKKGLCPIRSSSR